MLLLPASAYLDVHSRDYVEYHQQQIRQLNSIKHQQYLKALRRHIQRGQPQDPPLPPCDCCNCLRPQSTEPNIGDLYGAHEAHEQDVGEDNEGKVCNICKKPIRPDYNREPAPWSALPRMLQDGPQTPPAIGEDEETCSPSKHVTKFTSVADALAVATTSRAATNAASAATATSVALAQYDGNVQTNTASVSPTQPDDNFQVDPMFDGFPDFKF